MKDRLVQVFNDRIGYHLLFDRLKGKTVDWQRESYCGVKYLKEIKGNEGT